MTNVDAGETVATSGESSIQDDPIRVLHVDDDEAFLDLVSTHLERDGLGVETATSAEDGLSRLAEVDCVVSDLVMPGMDGLEFLKRVREERPALPFIVYTGEGSEDAASEAIEAGVTGYLQKGSGKQYRRLSSRIRDAVERYHTEQACIDSDRYRELIETKERFRKVFEGSHDAIVVVDIDAEQFLEVNPAACEMFGYDREELLDCHPRDIHPSDIEHVREEFLSQVLEEGSGWTDDLECVTKHGDVVPTEISAAVLDADENGDPTTMVAILRDISERETFRRDLQREIERLDSFASVISHDLRNPLNVAMARVELAREECNGADEHFERADAALERMESLITDLLALAREGQTIDETEPVSLDRLLENCWANVESDSATLHVGDVPTVEADRNRLKQVFENLFRNAIEHGGDGVTIAVGRLEDGDGFYVEDDGPGVPAEERDRLFEPGYSTATEGTGFGLAIVENVVRAHGWEIAVTDSDEGGARFEISGVTAEPRSASDPGPT